MTRDEFEEWLFLMEDEIEGLIRESDRGDRKLFDFSVNTIPDFEQLVLRTFPTVEAAKGYENRFKLDRLARYLGQTIRKNASGKWDVELQDTDYAFFELPIIRTPVGVYCPLTLTIATTDRRTGKYLSKIFNTIQRRLDEAQ